MKWFHVGRASAEFVAAAGDTVILISIEVSTPEKRELTAYFQVRGLSRQFFVSGHGARLDEVSARLGRHAASKAERELRA